MDSGRVLEGAHDQRFNKKRLYTYWLAFEQPPNSARQEQPFVEEVAAAADSG